MGSLFQYDDVESALGQLGGQGRAARPGADDDHVTVDHRITGQLAAVV